jgi:pimeloyl-ACP methyl ester carboxylesterase
VTGPQGEPVGAPRAVERVGNVDVRITRRPGKPLVLLVRMASGGMGIWDAVWDDLAAHFTVANFDLVDAAGLHAEAPPRERFLRLADAVADVAQALGFPRFHVFGWYGGTHVALACMLRHAERLQGALLLDPFFQLPDPRKLEMAIAFKRRLFEADDRALYAYYWVMAGFSPAFLETRFDEVERLARARIQADRFVTLDVQRWMRWVRALRTNWLTDDELRGMRTTTTVLATTLDSWHAGPTVGMAQALCERLPSATLRVIDGYGTFFFIERPDLFRAAAAPFFAGAGS